MIMSILTHSLLPHLSVHILVFSISSSSFTIYNIYANYEYIVGHGRPPVYVHIPYTSLSPTSTHSFRPYSVDEGGEHGGEKTLSFCLNALQESMEVTYLPYAHTMSIKAKHKIFW